MADTLHENGHGHAEHAHEPHIVPVYIYRNVFLGLLGLLLVTVAAAYIHFPQPGANVVVALVIAVIKAGMVVLYFMGVKYGSRLTWLWAGLGFIWLLLMIGILSDYISRDWVRVIGW